MELHLSELDTDRFGINVAKVILEKGDSVARLFDSCVATGVQLLIARVAAGERDLIDELEAGGASLADTLLYHRKAVEARHAMPLAPAFSMRLANANDASSVEALARRAFDGYTGHYHNDARLNKRDANEVYASWARNCCLKTGADEVFVVEHQGYVIAFAALRRIDDATIDCALCAVDSHWRGRRLLDALLTQCESWALDKGYASIEYSTHGSNVAARSVIERLGFVGYKSVHTFHKWFDAR